jgi:drug/metabolite transporter (DMT)-like permease
LPSELATVIFGLLSAASYGSGDFSGGFASKRNSVYAVVIFSQTAGLLFYLSLAAIYHDPFPPLNEIILAMLGGISGAIGLMSLYKALSLRNMGLTAPIVGVLSAATPVIFAAFTLGLPELTQLIGFGLGLIAVWLISGATGGSTLEWRALGLPFRAGLMFGLGFIFYAEATETATYIPLAFARTASIGSFLTFALLTKQEVRPQSIRVLPLLVLVGVLDACGNLFYVLAKDAGRIDVASVVTSMYPAMTVLLAWIILKERLSRVQWIGVAAAMIAITLIVI